jgi:arylsulfatase A-like enzyme
MDPAKVRVPEVFSDTPEVRSDICDYFFEIQRFDQQIGEMLKLIEQAGQLDNTLVVITSDNGMPFPRAKANLYDLGSRMPLARLTDHLKKTGDPRETTGQEPWDAWPYHGRNNWKVDP